MWRNTIVAHRRLSTAGALVLLLNSAGCYGTVNQPEIVSKQVTKDSTQEIATRATLVKQESPTQEEIAADAAKLGYKVRRGQYTNYEYGYTVSIPKGFVGISDPSPQPQHGFGITLSKQPKAEILVGGTYNAAEYESLDEAVDADLDWLKKQVTELEVLKRAPTTLGNLQAMQLMVRYKSPASGETMMRDLITAIRNRKEETGIVYEIGLTTPEARHDEDSKVFDQVVKTWTLKPLPR